MALRHKPSRSRTVGIAIAAPRLRRSVLDVLGSSGRYDALAFDSADIEAGTWPRGRFAAVVATPAAFRARQALKAKSRIPVILVVREADLVKEKAAMARAPAFVLANRLDSLPSTVVLSRDRLSILPRIQATRPSSRVGATKKK